MATQDQATFMINGFRITTHRGVIKFQSEAGGLPMTLRTHTMRPDGVVHTSEMNAAGLSVNGVCINTAGSEVRVTVGDGTDIPPLVMRPGESDGVYTLSTEADCVAMFFTIKELRKAAAQMREGAIKMGREMAAGAEAMEAAGLDGSSLRSGGERGQADMSHSAARMEDAADNVAETLEHLLAGDGRMHHVAVSTHGGAAAAAATTTTTTTSGGHTFSFHGPVGRYIDHNYAPINIVMGPSGAQEAKRARTSPPAQVSINVTGGRVSQVIGVASAPMTNVFHGASAAAAAPAATVVGVSTAPITNVFHEDSGAAAAPTAASSDTHRRTTPPSRDTDGNVTTTVYGRDGRATTTVQHADGRTTQTTHGGSMFMAESKGVHHLFFE